MAHLRRCVMANLISDRSYCLPGIRDDPGLQVRDGPLGLAHGSSDPR